MADQWIAMCNASYRASYCELRRSQFGNSGRGGTKIRTCNYLKDRAVDDRTGATVNVRNVIDKSEFELLN